MGANVNIDDNAEGQEGGSTNGGTDEGVFLSILPDGGVDPQVERGRDFVGGSRERKLKTATGANRGFRISTDDRETKSDKR